MNEHLDRCIDPRGRDYVAGALDGIAKAMGCGSAEEGAEKLGRIFEKLGLAVPEASEEAYAELKTSVKPVRLKNHPIALDEETIEGIAGMNLVRYFARICPN